MRIGIIGAGRIGSTLAELLVARGHDVVIANSRGPATLREVAAATGATPVDVMEAAKGADVIVVTIPQKNIPLLPKGVLSSAPEGTPIIDTCNYFPHRDGRIDGIESGLTDSQWVAEQLGRPVIKAFNNIRASHIVERTQPAGAPGRVALPVSGDDPAAKARVLALVDEIGFDPIDVGGIDESWRQQPGKPVFGTDLDVVAARAALAAAKPERPDELRAT